MLALAGGTAEGFAARGYDGAMVTQIETGILRYCGVAEPRLATFYGALEGDEATAGILAEAARMGAAF
jgi:NAD(P)H dehydrogenase (quinone)